MFNTCSFLSDAYIERFVPFRLPILQVSKRRLDLSYVSDDGQPFHIRSRSFPHSPPPSPTGPTSFAIRIPDAVSSKGPSKPHGSLPDGNVFENFQFMAFQGKLRRYTQWQRSTPIFFSPISGFAIAAPTISIKSQSQSQS